MAVSQVLKETPELKKDGRVLESDEVFYWGEEPLTAGQIAMALKHYHNIKVRAAETTLRRRKKQKEEKLLAQQKS